MSERISDLDRQIAADPRHPASAAVRENIAFRQVEKDFLALLEAVAPNRVTRKKCKLCGFTWHRSDNRACLVAQLERYL